MKIQVNKLNEHLSSDPDLDTNMDVGDKFISISVRCIETNEVANRSINIEEMESTRLEYTQYIMDEMDTMKDNVRGNYY